MICHSFLLSGKICGTGLGCVCACAGTPGEDPYNPFGGTCNSARPTAMPAADNPNRPMIAARRETRGCIEIKLLIIGGSWLVPVSASPVSGDSFIIDCWSCL